MAVGIICEYNPFHNGHLYHINKVKELFPNEAIVLVMSGNFVERGDVSIINKWDKTKLALTYGVDLVVELPYAFASQSADLFAKGSTHILNALKVNHLVFGSESNDIEELTKIANIQINSAEYNSFVKKYSDEGNNYPSSLSKALRHFTTIDISGPNDTLGISYIRELIKLNSNIIPVCIKRTNIYHDTTLDTSISSATSIREAIKNGKDISKQVPIEVVTCLKKELHTNEDYFKLLKYKILSSKDLSIYQTVDEGIENRIKEMINKSHSFEQLVNNIKTKRYTSHKISRMLVHILCDFTKEEAAKMKDIEYIRILGFNKTGQQYLNSIKKDIQIPILVKYEKGYPMLDLEMRTTSIYATSLSKDLEEQLNEYEYKKKPTIKGEFLRD